MKKIKLSTDEKLAHGGLSREQYEYLYPKDCIRFRHNRFVLGKEVAKPHIVRRLLSIFVQGRTPILNELMTWIEAGYRAEMLQSIRMFQFIWSSLPRFINTKHMKFLILALHTNNTEDVHVELGLGGEEYGFFTRIQVESTEFNEEDTPIDIQNFSIKCREEDAELLKNVCVKKENVFFFRQSADGLVLEVQYKNPCKIDNKHFTS